MRGAEEVGAADELLLVLSTAPDRERAEQIGRALVEERLVACVNLVPGLRSIYRWGEKLQAEGEVLLLMKTSRTRFPQLAERFPGLHPYEVPELLALPISHGLAAYCRWVHDETREEVR
jgi:periplasmic divalent cation tolerance protein